MEVLLLGWGDLRSGCQLSAFDGVQLPPALTIETTDVTLDALLSVEMQGTNVERVVFFHVCHIWQLISYLSPDLAMVIHTTVTFRLVYSLFKRVETLTGTLEVQMGNHQMIAFLNQDVSLPCNINGHNNRELDIKKMAVTWYLRILGEKTDKVLYSVVSGEHNSHRRGLQMNESKLKRGNCELFIPHIQLNEEGTYVCSVIVTPDRAEGTKIITIFAQPTVILTPTEVTIERDREMTLSCIVHKFYPDLINIFWQKYSKKTLDKKECVENICTGSSEKNGDGTFNITSKLWLQPSSQDDGDIYSCIVDHKSFLTNQMFNATLTITDPPQNLSWIAGLFFMLIAIGGFAAFVYYWWFMKIKPTILAFVGNTELKHMEKSEFLCLISGFRPKPLDVTFFITPSNNEKQKIFSWNTKASNSDSKDEECPLLTKHEAIKIDATWEEKKRKIFHVSCKICITPDVKLLGEFELSLEVSHGTLPHGFLVETASFKVIALPLLDPIWCSTDMPTANESMTLNCKIHSYFPQTIDVFWNIDDEQLPEKPILSKPVKATDGLFFCTSTIKYLPKAVDSGKKFLCKANLSGSLQCRQSVWEMKTVVHTPKVSEIDCEPSEPECGKAITLSCSVKDFNPPTCKICWRRGFEKLTHAQIYTKEPYQDATSNLYCMESQASFIPKPEDHLIEFVVEIDHCNKTTRNIFRLMLKGFPKVSDITVDPNDVEYGIPLSLTCRVLDFYPKGSDIHWYSGDDLVRKDKPVKDQKDLLSKLQLEPTALDYDKTIYFKVILKKSTNPITKSVHLKLPAKSPVVSEIKEISEQAGKVSLEISITNFAPRHIRVVWYKDWKKLSDVSDPSDICIEENKLCSFTSKIKINRNETNIEKKIRCEVYHPKTNSFQEKSFVLKSKDLSGNLEQIPISPLAHNHIDTAKTYSIDSKEVLKPLKIDCLTNSPKSGENVTLCCLVHGKRADEAHVSWYKGLLPVTIFDGKVTNTSDESGFISHMTIKTEAEEQKCEIRCEVSVDAENWEETYILELR
ncbi:natural cytotoxicity triggering receptor 3 ligand 1 [Sphaerodactylus townsendi]|uniref:natural cytotoxicity triggering receptor 3 ligand 1 n=1 Tax=Sphaerodactylus townsendi TaxID=933632 RepID=UPI0020274009|nr:natural cytotoxicity triggering receptor 3 ligand 1 [Sphaerodactylus townsendi]